VKKGAEKKGAEKKEVGFVTVINTILGIILVIFGLAILLIPFYIIAITSVILGIFLLLPQKILRFSKWLKLLIVIIGFIAVIMIQGASLPSSPPEVEYYSLNEPFLIEYKNINFSMVIYNSTKEKTISVGGQEKTTTGIFLKINGGVTNTGNSAASDFSLYTGLEDGQNNSYESLGYNFGVGPFQPNLKKDFFYVFEIPKDAVGLRFYLSEDRKSFKIIDLGI
jgi:hypothetical protein